MAGLRVYKHSNFGGNSAYWSHSVGNRYYNISKGTLQSMSLHDKISSLRLYCSSNERETAILFSNDRYKGRFIAFSGSHPRRDIPQLSGNYNFNDITSSILLISHSDNEFLPISLGQHMSENASAEVDAILAQMSRVKRRGNIVFTWEMWPYFSPLKKYIRIDLPLRINVPAALDLNARISYFVYLYIDNSYKLRGTVDKADTWVANGLYSGKVNKRLNTEAQNSIGMVTAILNDALTELEYHEWKAFYLMPGIAPIGLPSDYMGSVTDDVTIMLVRRTA